MSALIDKSAIKDLVDHLPEGATIDDLMCELYVLEAIQQGRADFAAGRFKSHSEVMAKYGLSK